MGLLSSFFSGKKYVIRVELRNGIKKYIFIQHGEIKLTDNIDYAGEFDSIGQAHDTISNYRTWLLTEVDDYTIEEK